MELMYLSDASIVGFLKLQKLQIIYYLELFCLLLSF